MKPLHPIAQRLFLSLQMNKALFIFCLLFCLSFGTYQANNYRIKVDFSIKEKRSDGSFSLQMGKAFYDINFKKLLYEINFPKTQTILTNDSSVYLIENGIAIDVKKESGFIEMSIFHLCLTGSIQNFGLQNSVYKATSVEYEDGMVMTTWEIPRKIKGCNRTKIVTSTKDRLLYGVVFISAENKVISKQFYQYYENINGTSIPTKITFIMYVNEAEQYRIMEFKNIKINEFGNENLYNYPIPSVKSK